MLYRPFLSFLPSQSSTNRTSSQVSYAYQLTGINVCRNIVHIGLEIRKQNVLLGPHWFILYTKFLAVLSLVVFVLDNSGNPTFSEILRDAELGKDGICGLALRSLPADRVSSALNVSVSMSRLLIDIHTHCCLRLSSISSEPVSVLAQGLQVHRRDIPWAVVYQGGARFPWYQMTTAYHKRPQITTICWRY